MTTELTLLAWSCVLGLVHGISLGMFLNAQHGPAYGLGPRDERKPLTGIGGRVERAFTNYLQNFPFFAAPLLIAHLAGVHDWLTVWGAQLFFWGRLAYVPLYAWGIKGPRSVAFGVALTGNLFVLFALL